VRVSLKGRRAREMRVAWRVWWEVQRTLGCM
jgi:hypothetical protein